MERTAAASVFLKLEKLRCSNQSHETTPLLSNQKGIPARVIEILNIMYSVNFFQQESCVDVAALPFIFSSKLPMSELADMIGFVAWIRLKNIELLVSVGEEYQLKPPLRYTAVDHDLRRQSSVEHRLHIQSLDERIQRLELSCQGYELMVRDLLDDIREYKIGAAYYQERIAMLDAAVCHIGQHIKISGG